MKGLIKYALIGITTSVCISLIAVSFGKEIDKNDKNTETLYTYVDNSSDDGQFESTIGLVVEQPILDENSQKIGKRLYIDSSKELLTKDSIKEFYNKIKETIFNYDEVIVSIENNEAIQVSIKNLNAWKCTINENMELNKIEEIDITNFKFQ